MAPIYLLKDAAERRRRAQYIHRLPGREDRARYAGPSRIAASIEAGSALSICAAACIATM